MSDKVRTVFLFRNGVQRTIYWDERTQRGGETSKTWVYKSTDERKTWSVDHSQVVFKEEGPWPSQSDDRDPIEY